MEETKKFEMRLLTFNCFGVPLLSNTRARLRTLARELDAADVDVVCLQEIQLSRYLPLLRRSLTQYPHAAYEPYIYAPKGGLVILSRWPIESANFVLYRERGRWHSPAVADWLLHKGILAAGVRIGDHPVIVVDTHLIANYSGNWSRHNTYARQQHSELRQLAQVVHGVEANVPCVIAGDFNLPRGSWLYNDFVAEAGVIDPLSESEDPTYRPLSILPGRFQVAIDHVFIRPPRHQVVTASAQLVFQEPLTLVNGRTSYLSDHTGILADVAFG